MAKNGFKWPAAPEIAHWFQGVGTTYVLLRHARLRTHSGFALVKFFLFDN
jgi:hypothetical protein